MKRNEYAMTLAHARRVAALAFSDLLKSYGYNRTRADYLAGDEFGCSRDTIMRWRRAIRSLQPGTQDFRDALMPKPLSALRVEQRAEREAEKARRALKAAAR